MSSRLPELVDPWRSADQNRSFSGRVELEQLHRLTGALHAVSGEAEFDLVFLRDEQRRPRISGHVRATLSLQCQRCLDELVLPVDAELNLAVIEVAAEAERLPEEVEPVQVEEGMLRLLDIVEDELILAIPQVPMHGPSECDVERAESAPEPVPADPRHDESDQKENPFSVLAGLRKDSEN